VLPDARFCGACGAQQTPVEHAVAAAPDSLMTEYLRPPAATAVLPAIPVDPIAAPVPAAPLMPAAPLAAVAQRPTRPPTGAPVAVAVGRPVLPPQSPAVAYPPPPSAAPAHTPASHGRRLVACLIDWTLVSFLSTILWFIVIAGVFGAVSNSSSSSAFVTALFVVLISYFVTIIIAIVALFPPFMARTGVNNGQTLGKQIMGLRVICLDGQPMDFARASQRELLWRGLVIGGFGSLLIITPIVNAIWPLFDERRQALHDLAARTLVVQA
jgi:uncharacterized RDD family membrane protein YckC